jgi:hypothetical protein
MVAWIITEVPGVREEVIMILNYRRSGSKVCKILEQLYIDRWMGLNGRLDYAKTGRTPYPAHYALVDGVPYGEELWCGSGDRFLYARKVDDLRVTIDDDGNEQLVWKERKRPDFSKFQESLRSPVSDSLDDSQVG